MSRCHDRPDRIELPGTGMLASHGGRGSGASGPSSERRRGLDLQPEDFASRDSKQGPSDLASRLEAWAGGVVERLQAFGLDGLDAGACVGDGDSHRVLFANAGPTNGDTTCLLLGVDSTGVRAGLEVPASQARRARLRFTDPARALELATALQALPEQFMLSASSDREPTQAQHATADDLRGVLDEVARTSSIDTGGADLASHASMWIGWTLPRDLALEHAALLDEQLEDALVALAQVFALLVEESGASREEGLAIQARRSAGRSAKGDGSAGRSAKGDGSAGRSAKGDALRGAEREGKTAPRGGARRETAPRGGARRELAPSTRSANGLPEPAKSTGCASDRTTHELGVASATGSRTIRSRPSRRPTRRRTVAGP